MRVAVIIILMMLAAGCGKKALFDELAESRLKVVIKGSYESNDPRVWTGGFPENADSCDDGASLPDLSPTKFMLDVAEIQLIDKDGTAEPFAKYREVFTFDLNDTEPFFNGNGVGYENDDVEAGRQWTGIRMFLRKMVFDGAMQYHHLPTGTDGIGSWYSDGKVYGVFDEGSVEGFDINPLQVNTYFDTLKENASEINRIFPLKIGIHGGLVFNYSNEETVLEIRMVVKNFIEKYEYDYVADGYHYIYRFYGPADWLRVVKADDAMIGGNVLAIARVYIPGKTVSLTNSNVPLAVLPNSYVVAIDQVSDCESLNSFDTRVPPVSRPDTCDNPKTPHTPLANDIESYLDFYLKNERYKEQYNVFAACVADGSFYSSWNSYNDSRNGYQLPPIATWTATGDFELKNVPYGSSWKICYATGAPAAGALPSSFNNAQSTTVSIGSNGAVTSP